MYTRRELVRDLTRASILALAAYRTLFQPAPAQQPPPPLRLKADLESATDGRVIELRGSTKAELKAESHGTIDLIRVASSRQDLTAAA